MRSGWRRVFHHFEHQLPFSVGFPLQRIRPLLSHHLVVDPTKLAQLATVGIGNKQGPVARNPRAAQSAVLKAIAEICKSDFIGVATVPPALTMSAGVVSSMCSAP